MHESPSDSSVPQTASPREKASTAPSGRAAIALSAFSGLGWLVLIPFFNACDQSEQLARHFSALFNLILIGFGGGTSTLLALIGLLLSRITTSKGNPRAGAIGTTLACIAFALGLIVLVTQVPTIVRILY